MKSIKACLNKHGDANPLLDVCALIYWSFYVMPGRIATVVHSLLLGCLFNSSRVSVHHSARVIGHSHMSIGSHFWAGPRLWLHAVSVYQGCLYSPCIVIGNHFGCSEGVHIAAIGQITIGDNVLVGSNVLITDHNHGLYDESENATHPESPPISRPLHGKAVKIGSNVFIGDNVKILSGSVISDGTVVACNSVVNGSLPPHSICAGVPARPIKYYSDAGLGWISTQNSFQ